MTPEDFIDDARILTDVIAKLDDIVRLLSNLKTFALVVPIEKVIAEWRRSLSVSVAMRLALVEEEEDVDV